MPKRAPGDLVQETTKKTKFEDLGLGDDDDDEDVEVNEEEEEEEDDVVIAAEDEDDDLIPDDDDDEDIEAEGDDATSEEGRDMEAEEPEESDDEGWMDLVVEGDDCVSDDDAYDEEDNEKTTKLQDLIKGKVRQIALVNTIPKHRGIMRDNIDTYDVEFKEQAKKAEKMAAAFDLQNKDLFDHIRSLLRSSQSTENNAINTLVSNFLAACSFNALLLPPLYTNKHQDEPPAALSTCALSRERLDLQDTLKHNAGYLLEYTIRGIQTEKTKTVRFATSRKFIVLLYSIAYIRNFQSIVSGHYDKFFIDMWSKLPGRSHEFYVNNYMESEVNYVGMHYVFYRAALRHVCFLLDISNALNEEEIERAKVMAGPAPAPAVGVNNNDDEDE